MTAADRRALGLLVSLPGLVRPGYFGECLWGKADQGLRNGYHGSNCSAPYARQAGKVLNRLRASGYVEWIVEGEGKGRCWGWRATPAGRREVVGDGGRRQPANGR